MNNIKKFVSLNVGLLSVDDAQLRPLLDQYAHAGLHFCVREPGSQSFSEADSREMKVLLVFGGRVNRALLDGLPRLQFIQLLSAGFDNVDLECLQSRGIRIADNAGLNADAVADHALMLMLLCLRNGIQGHSNVLMGRWQSPPLGLTQISQLTGKTVGIVGLGRIGSRVAKRALGFDTEVIFHDIVEVTLPSNLHAVQKVSLDELVQRSDIVTLHVPLTDITERMVSASFLSCMKVGSVLINTCRGPVVDLNALEAALRRQHLRSAGLDVFPVEPFTEHPLISLPNVVLSPHRAGSSAENWESRLKFAFANIDAFSNNRSPLSQL